MKALTLHQPWASLIALGVKTIETRSWSTPYRGRLAIHAGVKSFGLDSPTADVVRTFPLDVYRRLPRPHADAEDGRNYPLGAIVATCDLLDVVPIVEHLTYDNTLVLHTHDEYLTLCGPLPGEPVSGPQYERRIRTDQRPYGDFTPGRFAWLLGDVKSTTERCPACWVTGAWVPQGPTTAEQVASCSTCDGTGSCPPAPAKGAQRLWEWTS